MKARLRTAALLAVALVGLAACGDDGDAAPTPGTTAPSTAPSGPGGSTTAPPVPTTPAVAPTPPGPLADVDVALTGVAELDEPIALAIRSGDEALYVASRSGTVHRIVGGEVDDEPVLDISADTRAGGERGLLGLAFGADGAHVYVHFTDLAGDSHIEEFAWAATGADAGSRRSVLEQEQPFGNHNGGHLVVGPDGLLYIGFGDGGSGGDPGRRAGDLGTWLGKLLRIDPRPEGDRPYGVPADNPFVDVDGARPEIWALGLRNPWRYSFDRATDDLWIADVGQNEVEEIDRVPLADAAGADYGWSALEGTRPFNEDVAVGDPVVPVYEYEHGARGCSITGGHVYRGRALPALVGAYVYADYCAPGIWALRLGADGAVAEEVQLDDELTSIASFGEGADGELYVLSLEGTVSRLDPG